MEEEQVPLGQEVIWPTSIEPDENLYAVVDSSTEEVKYLVFDSADKYSTLVRDNKAWFKVDEDNFYDQIDDPDLHNVEVDIDFISSYDEQEQAGEKIFIKKPVTAAAPADCPPATQDIALNLKNRKNAIDTAMYGPLNPTKPNTEYWQKLADEWSVDVATAKEQRCGNCAVFVVTSEMKSCIEKGVTGGSRKDSWDGIDAAGELGYCEAFDFKCASARTCRAWVTGGPVSDNIQSN